MPVTSETRSRNRAEIAETHKWKLEDIFPDWRAWESALGVLDKRIGEYAALKGTLAKGPDQLLAAYRLNDELGQLAYTVYYYPSLKYDEDQRDNPDQRAPAAGAGAHGALGGRNVVAQPGVARDSAGDRPRLARHEDRSGRVPFCR
jgi:hypothetical protein